MRSDSQQIKIYFEIVELEINSFSRVMLRRSGVDRSNLNHDDEK